MTVAEALARVTALLQQAGVPEPQTDAEWLLAHVLCLSRTNLRLEPERRLTEGQWAQVEALVWQRCQRVPLAYLLGTQNFCGLELVVDRRVMVPRSETEDLVDLVTERLQRMGRSRLMLADIGTGSGAIALALAARFPAATVYGLDISVDALAVAELNAARLRLDKRVAFLHGDLTEPLEAIFPPRVFDALVANLPYVADEEWERLPPEVRCYEPPTALRGGPDGLAIVRRLLRSRWQRLLTPDGFIALELGVGQPTALLRELDGRVQGTTLRDLAGRERFLIVQPAGATTR
ncbi:Release factor glutamine methyltransferase [bacterium HR17]|jgi:release factor glutamine methyltransferase|uniref:Release factor glutamine methyltransferase n=1 Tax=Candidatus Fervidibacter japonicus TaxID=2035412 RepID=A0A2H5X8X2_9BACT|nr:Release factor glutamine methyltransferase [bacterium HR17]